MNALREDMLPLVPQLRAYARVLTAGDADLSDDLVQDTLMLAIQAWDRFRPGTDLRAWLFQILRNRFCSVVTRRYRRVEIRTDAMAHLAAVPAFQENRPEIAEFKLAFARLTPAHRNVLVLRAVQGLPYEEIAELCGCEIGTVKSRISRARALLKEMLLGEASPTRTLRDPPIRGRRSTLGRRTPGRCGAAFDRA